MSHYFKLSTASRLWIQSQLLLLFAGYCDSSHDELRSMRLSGRPVWPNGVQRAKRMMEETQPLFVSDNGTFPFPVFPVNFQGTNSQNEQKPVTHRHQQTGQDVVFMSKNNTVVNSHTGSTVTLPCIIRKETKFGMITWARQLSGVNTSYQILTIGDSTYIDDPRFLIDMSTVNYDWSIQILRVNPFDSGAYKCLVNSHPPQYITTFLTIVDAFARLAGPNEKFIKTGSELFLNCSYYNISTKPDYVFWYHDSNMISHSGQERGQRVDFNSSRHSTLYIPNVKKSDSGNYTCKPHNLRPASVYIHIIDDESNSAAAAIHRTDETNSGGGGDTKDNSKDGSVNAAASNHHNIYYFSLSVIVIHVIK